MQTAKSLDRHKTKVGKRRKECERIIRESLKISEREATDKEKAQLWDIMISAAALLYEKDYK